ncbi:MAG: hypothetical protein AAF967_01940 [Pseudomonadota bacterium]
MDALVSSGRLVDLILVFVAVEAAGLTVYRIVTGRGLELPAIASMLLPGVCLLLALRAALMGAQPVAVLLWLSVSLLLHLADLWRRWRER